MLRILKYLVVLAVIALLALSAYAIMGDYAPEERDIDQPVTLSPV